MKKLLFGFSVLFTTLISAQNYPDYYPTNSNNYPNSYGSDEEYDDEYYFPDDYYYEYPSGYYTNDFYQGSYNDYRRSIDEVNWNRFFAQHRLTPFQVQQIMMLNDSYSSYNAWNNYYHFNPDRWYYDRFFALQHILGPKVFVVFQNNYYHGYNPVVYYQNYRRQHYVTNIYVVKKYRNINVNRYKVDRNNFNQNNPRNSFGFRDGQRNGNGNWQNASNDGFRSNSGLQNNTGNDGFSSQADSSIRNNIRKTNPDSRAEADLNTTRTKSGNDRGGFRNNNSNQRNTAPTRKMENNSRQQKTPSSGTRSSQNSGMRFTNR